MGLEAAEHRLRPAARARSRAGRSPEGLGRQGELDVLAGVEAWRLARGSTRSSSRCGDADDLRQADPDAGASWIRRERGRRRAARTSRGGRIVVGMTLAGRAVAVRAAALVAQRRTAAERPSGAPRRDPAGYMVPSSLTLLCRAAADEQRKARPQGASRARLGGAERRASSRRRRRRRRSGSPRSGRRSSASTASASADNFFHLGGHSLLAARVVTRSPRGVRRRRSPCARCSSIRRWPLSRSRSTAASGVSEQRRGDRARRSRFPRQTYPPSFSQQQLLFIDELAPDIATYNGSARRAHRRRARSRRTREAPWPTWSLATRRCDTVFRWTDRRPVQVVLDRWELDARGRRPDASFRQSEREAELRASSVSEEAERPFDLGRDLMLRATLFRLGPDEHVLLVVTHHIASDGWSVGVFCRELGECYEAHRDRSDATPPRASAPVPRLLAVAAQPTRRRAPRARARVLALAARRRADRARSCRPIGRVPQRQTFRWGESCGRAAARDSRGRTAAFVATST